MVEIIEMIQTVGFPIAMCLLMFWYIKYQRDTHTEELNKLREAVDKLSDLITKMCDKLEFRERDNNERRD